MPSFEEIPDLGWEPEVLEAKTKSIRKDAVVGVIVGVVGLILGILFGVLFGVLFGAYAIYSGSDALVTVNVYGVGRDYKVVARVAQLLGALSILLPVANFLTAFAQR